MAQADVSSQCRFAVRSPGLLGGKSSNEDGANADEKDVQNMEDDKRYVSRTTLNAVSPISPASHHSTTDHIPRMQICSRT